MGKFARVFHVLALKNVECRRFLERRYKLD